MRCRAIGVHSLFGARKSATATAFFSSSLPFPPPPCRVALLRRARFSLENIFSFFRSAYDRFLRGRGCPRRRRPSVERDPYARLVSEWERCATRGLSLAFSRGTYINPSSPFTYIHTSRCQALGSSNFIRATTYEILHSSSEISPLRPGSLFYLIREIFFLSRNIYILLCHSSFYLFNIPPAVYVFIFVYIYLNQSRNSKIMLNDK